mgnify:FL=1
MGLNWGKNLKILERLLPDEGYICLIGLSDDGPMQTFHTEWEEVYKQIDLLLSIGKNVHFALSTFDIEKRNREAVTGVKSFWLDIDCGENKDYPSQAIAIKEVMGFCKKTRLPRPTLINSGNGLHCYWILDGEITKEEWQPLAEKLRQLCVNENLKTDAAVTCDISRALRVPDTLNYKTTPPKKVSVLSEAPDVPFDELVKVLDGVDIAVNNTTDFEPDPNKMFCFKKILSKTIEGEGCEQIKYGVTKQNEADYNFWRAVLSIATNCSDSEKSIHIVSNKHKKYNPNKTIEKAKDLLNKPYRCSTFDKYRPGVCTSCKHWQKIKSPIVLGMSIKQTEIEDNKSFLDKKFPQLPDPYFRAVNGGIYRKSRDLSQDDLCIYENDLFITKRLNDKERGDMVLAQLNLPKDGIREFLIPLSTMTSKEELRKLLAIHGIVMMSKQLDQLMAYLIACTKNQQKKHEAEIMRTQFGWTDDNSTFILGDKEINCSAVKYSPPSPNTESICKWLTHKGDMDKWKEVIRIYNKPEFEPHCFGLFTAFGAPLIKHLGFNGALINLINSSSGTGKSTILKVCNSVYGHPDKLLAQETDTFAHKMYRLGVMNNLPYTVDEITNMHPESVSALLYNVSQGSGPGRMQASTNVERKNDTNWSLIALASSNASMAEKLSMIKSFADGEIMRLLEYRLDRTNNISKADAHKLFEDALLNNYGLAGPIYIQWLVKNLSKAINVAKDVQKTLDKRAGLNAKERFWSAVIACNITGAHMAKNLDLIDLDVDRVLRWSINELVPTLRDQMLEPEIDFIAVLGGFLNNNRGNILVIDGQSDARNKVVSLPIIEPRYELTVRLEPDTKKMYIYSKAIKDYCVKQQITFKDLVRNLKQKGIYEGSIRKRLAKGTSINSPPVEYHIFNLEDGFIDTSDFIKELNTNDKDTRDTLQNKLG